MIPVDDALARLATKSGHEHFERREILEKVQNRYLEFARAEPDRFVVVDAMLDKDEVARLWRIRSGWLWWREGNGRGNNPGNLP